MKTKVFTLFLLGWLIQNIMQAQYIKLMDFSGTNGGSPRGCLVFDGIYFYGATGNGGVSNNDGVFFKIKPDGSSYQNLHNFSGQFSGDGAFPNGSVVFDGTYFYGATSLGGLNNKGIIFKIKPDGTGYSNAHDFLNYTPIGSLVFNGINFYGATGTGGLYGSGGILKMNLSLPNDTFVYSLTGNEGTNPFSSIIYDGTFIYGTANQGGLNGKGVVFKVKPDGSAYDTLLNFGTALGANPVATPYYDGTYLYGTTINGGTNNKGTIYRVKPNGTGDTVLFNFSAADGYQSQGALILVRGHLYGMTSYGGINDYGVVFRVKADGTNYTKLLDFNGSLNGSVPQSSLTSDGTFLYGMTEQGGSNGYGTVFKLKIPVITNDQNPTVCKGQNVMVGAHTYSVTGVYVDTLYSFSQDCDSIINTNLTVVSSSSSTSQSYTLCSGQSVNVGTDIYTSSGTYTYTYSGGGCDSILLTNLVVNPSPTLSVAGDTSVCVGQISTTTLTASGGGTYLWNTGSINAAIVVSPSANTIYSVVATNGACTDTAFVHVAASTPPHAGFNSTFSSCCTSNWFFTDTTHAVSGDPIVSWNWTFSGGYPDTSRANDPHVSLPGGNHIICLTLITKNGCKDSTCEYVFSTAINGFTISSGISIYPNPVTNSLTVSTKELALNGTVQIMDILGNEVRSETLNLKNNAVQIDVSDLLPGVYFLRSSAGAQKFVKQ